jgi:hypothetical protein
MASYKVIMNMYRDAFPDRNPEKRRLDGNTLWLKVKKDPEALQSAIDDLRFKIIKKKADRLSVF